MEIVIPFNPHPFQRKIIDVIKRFTVLVCHRRFGKSTLMVNLLIKGAAKTEKHNWRAAYVAPWFKQAKMIAWDYLNHYGKGIPGIHFNNSELVCSFPNGSRIYLLGSDNPDSLRGPYWDVVIFDEYAQVRPNVWPEIIRPALVDRKGWAIFIGTPKGKNHFWQLWKDVEEKQLKDWARVMFKASETTILDHDELENTKRTMSPEEFAQEFECSWEAALVGSYYGDLMADVVSEGRIGNVPYDPLFPVHTAWDLGIDDEMVIWFFQIPPTGEIRVIDFEEGSNISLNTAIRIIKDKKYIYGYHLAPHDIKVRELTTGIERVEFAKGVGISFEVVPKHNIADGIHGVRSVLPRAWFDATRCHHGVEALKTYRKEYSKTLCTYKDRPFHDWSSHGADAFRTLAMGLEQIKSYAKVLKIKMPSMRSFGEHGWMQ